MPQIVQDALHKAMGNGVNWWLGFEQSRLSQINVFLRGAERRLT